MAKAPKPYSNHDLASAYYWAADQLKTQVLLERDEENLEPAYLNAAKHLRRVADRLCGVKRKTEKGFTKVRY